jgi:hypothetical protein
MGKAPNSADFDHEQKVMSMFCDNAKTYIQLSSAALALTLTFARQILHVPDSQNIANFWMISNVELFSTRGCVGCFLSVSCGKVS